jgi:hypothetical protein
MSGAVLLVVALAAIFSSQGSGKQNLATKWFNFTSEFVSRAEALPRGDYIVQSRVPYLNSNSHDYVYFVSRQEVSWFLFTISTALTQ